jgi:hypothetical protein
MSSSVDLCICGHLRHEHNATGLGGNVFISAQNAGVENFGSELAMDMNQLMTY